MSYILVQYYNILGTLYECTQTHGPMVKTSHTQPMILQPFFCGLTKLTKLKIKNLNNLKIKFDVITYLSYNPL